MKLAKFNNRGISAFRDTLEYYRKGGAEDRVTELLESDDLIKTFDSDFSIQGHNIESRLQLANAVQNELSDFNLRSAMGDTGLWSWLSAALLDVVCPISSDGMRHPGKDYRHIPSENFRDFYRHLIRGPVRTLNLFSGDEHSARIIFCQAPDKPGDFVEQLASRQERVTSHAVIQVASELYYDESREKPKIGVSPNEAKPGTLRRYLNVLDQLELTYDLYTIEAKELISLLPSDFDRLH